MLGQLIHDPSGLEGMAGSSTGLGWLDYSTTLDSVKQLHNVHGALSLEDAPVTGYEIHAGVTSGPALENPALYLQRDGSRVADGAISADGQILATYLHGLFESPRATEALLRWAGLSNVTTSDYTTRRERDIERLADAVEAHLDKPILEELFGLHKRISEHA